MQYIKKQLILLVLKFLIHLYLCLYFVKIKTQNVTITGKIFRDQKNIQKKKKTLILKNTLSWSVTGYDTTKYALLAYALLWAEGNWEQTGLGKRFA